MYRENDWVYVIAADSRQEGFIPHSYCTPYNSHLGELALSNVKKKLPREQRTGNSNSNGSTVGAGNGEGVGETDLQETRTNGGILSHFQFLSIKLMVSFIFLHVFSKLVSP